MFYWFLLLVWTSVGLLLSFIYTHTHSSIYNVIQHFMILVEYGYLRNLYFQYHARLFVALYSHIGINTV